MSRVQRTFGILILVQAAHSVEEYVGQPGDLTMPFFRVMLLGSGIALSALTDVGDQPVE